MANNNTKPTQHLDIPVCLADADGTQPAWLTDAVIDAGFTALHQLSSIDDLSLHTRELFFSEDSQPFLTVISAKTLDEKLIERCSRYMELGEGGWMATVFAIYGAPPEPTLSARVSAHGGFDVIHIADNLIEPHELRQRLQLSINLLSERRIRLNQERSFTSRMAENRVFKARLHYLTRHDELTDLANRESFEKSLCETIKRGRQQQRTHALIYLDLDHFKLHNEVAGHQCGDELLQTVANKLRRTFPHEPLLARLGSDEFAVLLQDVDEDRAYRQAELLRNAIAGIEPDGTSIIYHVGASIGLSLIHPATSLNASQQLARAEQACFVAKSRGGNAVHLYSRDDDILQHLRDDMHWSQPIRLALGSNQLFLTFQPVLNLNQGSISHFEALVRMPESLGGDGNSARFMLAAERLGLAQQVDLWVVNNAIDYLVEHADISLGVNLSSHAFQANAMMHLLDEKLQDTNIDPQRLTFEITETSAIMNFADTRRMVNSLRDLGCRFALDDFGSGFSTYHYLKQFPIDLLKIDGSFIINLKHEHQDQTIVQSMIDIAHGLGKEVVAEFIEDAETLGMLTQMGLDHAQGYYIGKPMTKPDICLNWHDRRKLQ